MEIGIDFDGTCVKHEFPEVGESVDHAVRVMRNLISKGHRLILFTMRSDIENPKSKDENIIPKGGNYLTAAVNWFKDNDLPLYGIQVNPTQKSWTHSPKAYCHLYIDDAALGCPLIYPEGEKPHVNWIKVEIELIRRGIL